MDGVLGRARRTARYLNGEPSIVGQIGREHGWFDFGRAQRHDPALPVADTSLAEKDVARSRSGRLGFWCALIIESDKVHLGTHCLIAFESTTLANVRVPEKVDCLFSERLARKDTVCAVPRDEGGTTCREGIGENLKEGHLASLKDYNCLSASFAILPYPS